MFEELQAWWQYVPAVSPQIQAALQIAGCVVVVLLGGHIVGSMVARGLRAKNFDAALRLPGSGVTEEHGITPTFIAGMLVARHRLGGGGLVGGPALRPRRPRRGRGPGCQPGVGGGRHARDRVGSGPLALATVDRLPGGFLDRPGHAHPQQLHGTVPSPGGSGRRGAYLLVVLLVLLMAADFFDWPLTRSSAQSLWSLAQHVLAAGAALGIGYLGARAARDLAMPDGAASPEKRAGQYTAVAIVAATTVLAVGMLLSSTGVLVGLAALAVLGFALWLVRGYLPDVAAGLQLRTNKIREVWFDETAWRVEDVGFLNSHVCRNGEIHRVPNHKVLAARFNGRRARRRFGDVLSPNGATVNSPTRGVNPW